jgi:hypothetical protein
MITARYHTIARASGCTKSKLISYSLQPLYGDTQLGILRTKRKNLQRFFTLCKALWGWALMELGVKAGLSSFMNEKQVYWNMNWNRGIP